MEKQVTGIIQARMTSSRLPGKVLKPVMGRPLLSYQLERLRFSHKLHDLVIATTVNAEDDPVVEWAEQEQVKVYRGSENDVLDRYYQAAKQYDCQHIMRITADCPLIQADYCDQAITAYQDMDIDSFRVTSNLAEGLGFEIFSFRALQVAWENARLKSEREHVSLYFVNCPQQFKIHFQDYQPDDSHIRVTVDEPEDYAVVKAVLEALYQGSQSYFGIDEIRRFLEENPEVFALNEHIKRDEGLQISLANDEVVR